jgi:hypothetical protein
MRLVSVARARAIWIMRLEDLNPRGRMLIPMIFEIAKRYAFVEIPKLEEIPHLAELNKPLAFSRGTFIDNAQIPISVELKVYSDSILADTQSSTDDSDAFINDLLNWATAEFGLLPYSEILKSHLYLSELWVQTNKSLNSINPQLEAFASRFSALVSNYSGRPISFATTGITFWNDRTKTNPFGPFRFERSETAPFEENRYYSAAPIPTATHLELLQDLESILMD